MNNNTNSQLSYTKKTDFWFFFTSVIIFAACIWGFKYWKQLGLNIIFIWYFLFKELRLATVFYAVIVRIILYPSAYIQKKLEKETKETEKEFAEIKKMNNVLEKTDLKKKLLNKHRLVFAFSWFHLCFMTMNAVTIGAIFFQGFSQTRLEQQLYTDLYLPKKFPIKTDTILPVVGALDLAKPNLALNFWGAVGAALVGLVEIVLNKKTSKRQLFKYLFLFPAGAYFLTYWVPSGFEFALLIFEILTVLIIITENVLESNIYKTLAGKDTKKSSEKADHQEKESERDQVKKLIKEAIEEKEQEKKQGNKEKIEQTD
jgi:hypothetical protein